MSRQRFERWTVIGLILTAIIFIVHLLLPDRRVQVHPLENGLQGLYGFNDGESGSSVSWKNQPNYEWVCDYKNSHNHGCGWFVHTDPEFADGMDLRPFDAVEISLQYDGPADRIRLFMSNFEPAFSQPGDPLSSKFLSMTFSVLQVQEPVRVKLSEFSVANWWLQDRRIRRQGAQPAFDNIVRFGVDLLQPGRHEIRVDNIILVGRWIKTESLLYIILGVWAWLFLLEGVSRCWQAYVQRRRERQMIIQLEVQKKLQEDERQRLAVLTEVDPLTGVYNRAGLTVYLQELFDGMVPVDVGVIVIALDHFRLLNDRWGYDMGDKVLKAYAAALSASLRKDDILARWGGKEFIVICRNQTATPLLAFAEKLRRMAGNYRFGGDLDLSITISIGLTLTRAGESFDGTFERAEHALRRAREGGRNRVEFD